MPTETTVEFGVQLPHPRGGAIIGTHNDSETERLKIEAMSYEVIEATRNYDEEKVVAYIRGRLVEIEERLGVKFTERSVSVMLPTNRKRTIEIDGAPSDE